MSLFLITPQIFSLRLRHQRLLACSGDPLASIEQALTDVCGVQAQDLSAGELSASVRAPGLTAVQVEAARSQPGAILRIWCMRGTLHLVTARDACWLIPFLGPRLITADRRRMAQLGWDEPLVQRASQLVLEHIASQGGLTRPEIARLLKDNHLPHEGQAPIHLLGRLVYEGRLCQGADRVREGFKPAPTFVAFESWTGPLQPLPADVALAELARRYLAAYAPASLQDMATWSGIKISEARRAWELLGSELAPVETQEGTLWLLDSQLAAAHAVSSSPEVVRLLPRFDIYLLGYTDRRLILAPEYSQSIYPGGGILAATLLVNGRLAGVWSSKMRGQLLEVSVQPFEELPAQLLPLLEGEAERVGHFWGVETVLKVI